MRQLATVVSVETQRGLNEVTSSVQKIVRSSGVRDGLCALFLMHTSASLVIQENADPSVQHDLEAFLSRLVADGDPLFTHTTEGEDDMPAHVKAALTKTSEQIPVVRGELALGTWQGIYVWEHRRRGQRRQLAIHVLGE